MGAVLHAEKNGRWHCASAVLILGDWGWGQYDVGTDDHLSVMV